MAHEDERDTDESDRRHYVLSDDDVDRIAKRVILLAGAELAKAAGKKALDEVYVAVGKGLLARIIWLVGVIGLVAIAWATKNHLDFK